MPSKDLLEFRLRYQQPDESEESRLGTKRLHLDEIWKNPGELDEDRLFDSAVSEFGMLLQHSTYSSKGIYLSILLRAQNALEAKRNGFLRHTSAWLNTFQL